MKRTPFAQRNKSLSLTPVLCRSSMHRSDETSCYPRFASPCLRFSSNFEDPAIRLLYAYAVGPFLARQKLNDVGSLARNQWFPTSYRQSGTPCGW